MTALVDAGQEGVVGGQLILVIVEFVAPPPGRFDIACSEFCGSGHGHMKAALISIAPLSDNP